MMEDDYWRDEYEDRPPAAEPDHAARLAAKDAEIERLKLALTKEKEIADGIAAAGDRRIATEREHIKALTEALRTIEERAEGLMEDGIFRAQGIRDIARAALDAVKIDNGA